jgi:hypothetical protein
MDDAHGVVGEIGRFDHPRPRAGGQAGQYVLAVLLVLVTAGLPSGVGDRGDQGGGAGAEPPGQHRQGRLPAAGGEVGGVVLDGIVQQRGARHVRVGDPIVRQDPDGDPEQVAGVGVALPQVPACNRDTSASASRARPRSAAGNPAFCCACCSR